MRRRATVVFVLALLLWAPAPRCSADTGQSGFTASIQLKDGRVLHNVRTVSDEGTSVVVNADEGMLKIDKSDLPDSMAGTLPARPAAPEKAGPEFVMQTFNPDLAPAEPIQEPLPKKPSPKPANPAAPNARPEANPVFKGCTIVSFQPKAFQNVLGSAEVMVRNGTDAPVIVRPGDFTCVTASGTRHVGLSMVLDAFPPIIRRREVVPPQGEIDDIVTFTPDSLDIASVRWSR